MTSVPTRRLNAALLTLWLLYFWVLMEWLFFATKPSFLSTQSLSDQFLILGVAPLVFLLPVLCVFLLLASLDALLGTLFRTSANRRVTLLAVLPASLGTAVAVILIDNFTYTAAGWGIVSTRGDTPYLYLLLVVGLWVWLWLKMSRWISSHSVGKAGPVSALVATGLSLACAAVAVAFNQGQAMDFSHYPTPAERPDILIFSSDGIEADHVSAYGYRRETTPNLDKLLPQSLLVEQAVANAGRTTGSTTAMLTGKYPATSRVIFPPHSLRGRDSFEHLPGILKAFGYVNIQESVRYYGDSVDLNMYRSFDHANGRDISYGSLEGKLYARYPDLFQFAGRITNRVKDRAMHLTKYRSMVNARDIVDPERVAKVYGMSDAERIGRVKALFREQDQPVFAHVHLMGSHCCNYKTVARRFSAGHATMNDSNRVDFYDDTILTADAYLGMLLDQLEDAGKLENTIVIYTSDHTRDWQTDRFIPLVFRFPGGEYAGSHAPVAQLIDVAPTLLDYLGVEPPDWMEGVSILSSAERAPNRAITVGSVFRKKLESPIQTLTQLVGAGPPLYGVRTMTLALCDRVYTLDVVEGALDETLRQPAPLDCPPGIGADEARSVLERHLQERGFTLPY